MWQPSEEKPYSCDQCSAKFTQKSSLTKHQLIHSGEKPYSCDQCLAKFSQKGSLTAHQRNHTGEKPYSCEDSMTSHQLVQSHRLIHSDRYTYQVITYNQKLFVISYYCVDHNYLTICNWQLYSIVE